MVKMLLPKVKRVPLGIIDDVIAKMATSDACLLRYKEHISRKLCNHLRRTPDHPAYAFMIRRAIAELKGSQGSSEEEISDFISEEYKNQMLSVAHASMVKFHLIKLCDKGEILCTTENRYIFPRVKKQKHGRQSISRHESEKDNQSREELNLEHIDQQNIENQNRLHEEQVTVVHEGNKELNICVFEEHPLAEVCQPNKLEIPVWAEEREVVERPKINKEECDETRGHHEISAREVTEENHVVDVQICEVIGKESDDRVRQSEALEKHADLMEGQNRDLYSSNVPLESFNARDKHSEAENQLDLEKSANVVLGAIDQRQRIESADIGDEVTLQAGATEKNHILEVSASKKIEGNGLNRIEQTEDVGKESKDRVKKGNVLENPVEVMLPEAEVIEQLNPKYINVLHLSANKLLELEGEANMTGLPNLSHESQPSEEAIQAITLMKGIFTGMLSRTKEMQEGLENMVEFFSVFDGSKNSSQPMTGEMASGHLLKLFDSVDMLRKQCELPSLKRALETTETCHKVEQKLKRQKRNPDEQCNKQFSQEPESKEQQQEKSSDVRSEVVSEEPYIKNLEQMEGDQLLEMQIQTASNSSASKPHFVSQRQLRPRIDGVVLPYPYLDKNIIEPRLISLSPHRGKPPMLLLTNIEEASPSPSPSQLNDTETTDHLETEVPPFDKDCNNTENQQLKEKRGRGRPRKCPTPDNREQVVEHSSGPNDIEMPDHRTDDVKRKVSLSDDHNHIGNGQRKKRKPGSGWPRKRGVNKNAEQPLYVCSGADKKSGRGRGRPRKSRLIEAATISGYCPADFCPG